MWFVFLILGIIWVFVLVFHLTIELNNMEKDLGKLADDIRTHHEHQ